MTNQQQPLFTPPPPSGYWLLHAARSSQSRAVVKGRTRAAEEFALQVKKGVDLMARPEPDKDKRLAGYRLKPLSLWYEQRAKFPDCGTWWDFRHCMEDWQKLAPVDATRDAVIQGIADIELQMELQAQLAAAPGAGGAPPFFQQQAPVSPETVEA